MLSAVEHRRKIKREKGLILHQSVEAYLDSLSKDFVFDLIITSPPYAIGKPYEKRIPLEEYKASQAVIIKKLVEHMSDNGSICWQVGHYVEKGCDYPLDIILYPIFAELGLKLRNRIVWHFGHGLHTKRRFSGRHETILWFTKGDDYTFNLDAVRVPSKYPGKRKFKPGADHGKLSGNPLGKNPEDVWDIPNVVGNHIEKKNHPCQFPVGLVERLVLALSNKGDIVYDPFAGSASTAVAAITNDRLFVGTEINADYVAIAKERIEATKAGTERYRSANTPIYDHTKSNLSKIPEEWKS